MDRKNTRFKGKRFRNAYVAATVRRGIAYQLRLLRGSSTQQEIGKLLKKPQNVISRLENPNYGKVSVQTLLDCAAAFDVALLVKFVTFGRFFAETEALSQQALVPLSFDKEEKVSEAIKLYSSAVPGFSLESAGAITTGDFRPVTQTAATVQDQASQQATRPVSQTQPLEVQSNG